MLRRLAALALISAAVMAPAGAQSPRVYLGDIRLSAGSEPDIVIDFVEHGVVTNQVLPDQVGGTLGISGLPPGTALNAVGEQEAQAVGQQLFDELGGPKGVAGIFAGVDIRMPETMAPFAALEDMTTQMLTGLDEMDGGIYAGNSILSPAGVLFYLTLLAWSFGLDSVPMPGSVDVNGAAFEDMFTNAVDTMYNDALANPVVSANGEITVVAGSGEAAISTWVLGNVTNPDLAFFAPRFLESLITGDAGGLFLPNGDVVDVTGNPTDGWTLVSWAGEAIPQNPGLLTELAVDVRNLVAPPQIAAYNFAQAVLSADPAAMADAAQTGLHNVGAAIAAFPGAVLTDTVDELANLVRDLAAGETFSAAFGSTIVGLTPQIAADLGGALASL
ncbi:histidine phosphatase family protein [Mycobacterium sp.]|uniref:histidine phosphatase family protein n=1 Tax=Mycobacterium sp. TaxID=1785 RepID=UPI00126ACE38|nr:histidine phosphatase family protein [Mycobacterium sp.]KAA8969695.1 MAG: histidine phosphatase family protein [Mycobacterium sp.]